MEILADFCNGPIVRSLVQGLSALKLPDNNLPYFPIAESRNVQVLDPVIVLGYPQN
jgi:S1-C subfamily serine protease